MKESGIVGPGSDYFRGMDSDAYRARVNTPAKNPEYFRTFHQPMIERAKSSFGTPIHVLDIACGPADELDFIKNDPDVQIIATDISSAILPSVKDRLGTKAKVLASDSALPAIKKNVAEVGVLVNAMIYVPDKMLKAMYEGLKSGGECAVNFRIFSNSHNQAFYDYYLQRGGRILDHRLTVENDQVTTTFDMKVLDYTGCVNDEGAPDTAIRQLAQQLYFQSIEDVEQLIRVVGFEQVKHIQFDFASPANPNNQVDVFILKKG